VGLSEQLYFPTPIYTGRLRGASDLNPSLLALIYAERERDPAGTQRSNYTALNGWHSRIDLHRDPAFRDVTVAINKELSHISADSGYDPSFRLAISSMWSIVNAPGSSNRSHIHPGCVWSGVYYVQTPAGCGNIEFTDPRTMHLMNQPKYIPRQKRKRSRWTKVNFTPEPGRLIVFPSWLYHSVAPNLTEGTGADADRVIISFNVNQDRRRTS
jgi:uncharacterized protein (TIGR02466 family)